ncbi:MAG: hypothetical protein JNJ46_25325 [Myxococcales bacterium]|nr:hypothetical protein [Myxococcales bacterium]
MADAELSTTLLRGLSLLLHAQALIVAAVLGALLGGALRAGLLLSLDRGHGWATVGLRTVAIACYLGLAFVYSALAAPLFIVDGLSLLTGLAALLTVASGVVMARLLWGYVPLPSLTGRLVRLLFLLLVLILALLALMRSGFLNLTTDRVVLRIELTGQTQPQLVRWAAPDQPPRQESLRTHQVILLTPDGEKVGEDWLYGDQIAIKGRVLRLHPALNAAGIENLFELQFLHNGYFTAERHSTLPHLARPLRPLGSLVVVPRTRRLRDRVLGWLANRPAESRASVRAVTHESTYFPLVDAQGQPLRKTYDLVLTPGGLTSR